jgi:hypothetical protein
MTDAVAVPLANTADAVPVTKDAAAVVKVLPTVIVQLDVFREAEMATSVT